MSDLCQHIDRGTECVQVFWAFQRAVKAAEVTKSVQETLNGKNQNKTLLTFELEKYGQQNKKSIWK